MRSSSWGRDKRVLVHWIRGWQACDNKPLISGVPCPLLGHSMWLGRDKATRTCLCHGRARTGTGMSGEWGGECWVMLEMGFVIMDSQLCRSVGGTHWLKTRFAHWKDLEGSLPQWSCHYLLQVQVIFGESLMNSQHYRCAVSYITYEVLYFRFQLLQPLKMQPSNPCILCEPWEEFMHLQLEPWSSGPASGYGFKDFFDHGDAFQNTYLLFRVVCIKQEM